MSISTYTVVGMTCGHCVRAVTEELGAVPGVAEVDVDLASGHVTLTGDEPPPRADVAAAVIAAGYELADESRAPTR